MSRPRLVVTDLDGTLLRSDRRLSAYTVRVLNGAIDAGMGLSYATARSYHTAKPLLARVAFRLPAITQNGALIRRPDTGDILLANLLDRDLAAEVVARGVAVGLPPFVFGFDRGREVVVHTEPVNEAQRRWLQQRSAAGDGRLRYRVTPAPPDEVLEVQFSAPLEQLTALAQLVRERCGDAVATSLIDDVYLPGYCQLEVQHPRANKRDALLWLADAVGVPLEAVAVIGDNGNDLPMFAVAGRRLAVANARAEVLAAADAVLACNDEDGVARYLAGVG